jgi:hypothetical protein
MFPEIECYHQSLGAVPTLIGEYIALRSSNKRSRNSAVGRLRRVRGMMASPKRAGAQPSQSPLEADDEAVMTPDPFIC